MCLQRRPPFELVGTPPPRQSELWEKSDFYDLRNIIIFQVNEALARAPFLPCKTKQDVKTPLAFSFSNQFQF